MNKISKKIRRRSLQRPKRLQKKNRNNRRNSRRPNGVLVRTTRAGGAQPNPEARSIMFVGDVTEERAADLISALLVLSQTKRKVKKEQTISSYTYQLTVVLQMKCWAYMMLCNTASNFAIFKQSVLEK